MAHQYAAAQAGLLPEQQEPKILYCHLPGCSTVYKEVDHEAWEIHVRSHYYPNQPPSHLECWFRNCGRSFDARSQGEYDLEDNSNIQLRHVRGHIRNGQKKGEPLEEAASTSGHQNEQPVPGADDNHMMREEVQGARAGPSRSQYDATENMYTHGKEWQVADLSKEDRDRKRAARKRKGKGVDRG